MRSVWWCNQSECWDDEYPLRLVCAPEIGKPVADTYHHTVGKVNVGDVAVHYRYGSGIVAVSQAITSVTHGPVPIPPGRECWQKPSNGWYYRAEYALLEPPLPKIAFIGKLAEFTLISGRGPVIKGNNIREGYFMQFCEDGLSVLRRMSLPDWPSWA